MSEQEKICAIFAADPMCFPWGYDEEDDTCILMKQTMKNEIRRTVENGYTRFHVAMDNGFGLYAAEYILELLRKDPRLSLHCFLPNEGQATKWTPEHRERYFNTLAGASNVVTVKAEDWTLLDYEAKWAAGEEAQLVITVTSGIMTDSVTEQAKRDLYTQDERALTEIDHMYGIHHHQRW